MTMEQYTQKTQGLRTLREAFKPVSKSTEQLKTELLEQRLSQAQVQLAHQSSQIRRLENQVEELRQWLQSKR